MFPTFEQILPILRDHIQTLEDKRSKIVSGYKKFGIGFALGLAILILCMVAGFSGTFFVFLIFIVYIGISVGKIMKQKREIRTEFKQHVVGKISTELLRQCELPNATDKFEYHCDYRKNGRIRDQYIRNSHLFNFKIDKTRGEDLFSGRIGLTDFQFSELELIQVRTSTDSKGRSTTKNVTMFDGILFVADFHKDFDGVTTLKSGNIFNRSGINSLLQGVGNIFSSQKKVTVTLENEEFNKAFHVVSTDEVKARYLLSVSMLERIMNFKKRHPHGIELSFVNSYMSIALGKGKDYFEPNVFKPFDGSQARTVYEDLLFFFGMIEDFDLNTRIWNKA
ncbi:DUF3137 domain-containing protein [Bacillus horti]|uniref:Membrane protein n=1 Tax=Caldalkalibacillus horti TaxID=77523 RepID=A0ABT9W4V2_9BACI|nr:DUF3137 domain-containing protein [Bacillus horti]MDQ0168279.1 putative membrane protein [Bacillus horti]